MANLTGFFVSPAANVNVTITDAHAAATMRIAELSNIKYEFDLTPDTLEINRLAAMYATIDVSILLYDSNGNDLYDRLINTTNNPVTVTANLHDGTTAYFKFTHAPADVTIDEQQKIVKVKCKPYTTASTMAQVFANANYSGDIMTYQKLAADDLTAYTYQCMAAGRFINRVMSELSPASVNVQSAESNLATMSQYIFEDFDNGSWTNDENVYVVVNVHSAQNFTNVTLANGTSSVPQNVPAFDTLKGMALLEGSIVGVGFDNFYRHRNNATAQTLSYSDCIDLSFKQGYQALQYIFEQVIERKLNPTSGLLRELPNLNQANITVSLNPNADKYANFVLSPAYPFLSIGKVNTASAFINGDGMPTDGTMEYAAVNAGATAYQKSFPASGNYIIQGKVRGISKMKPFTAIEFDSTVPERYQNKTFRSTYLSYDLYADQVEFKAYEI